LTPSPCHTFTTTPCISKNPHKKPSKLPPPTPDPFDFTLLTTAVQTALQKLKDDLASLRVGRLNPATIEGLRVRVGGKNGEMVRLGDVAQVVPRGGRGIVVQVLDSDVS
jgi:ribosome recycling factor